jgi:hypothetical protein
MNISSAWRTSAAVAVLAMAPLAATVADSNPTLSTAAAFVKRVAMRHWLANGERGLWIQAANL